jgi:hypothetical protein
MSKDVLVDDFRFNSQMVPPVVGSPDSGYWRKKTTGAGGGIVNAVVSGGLYTLAMDATNEVQNLCLYGGDVLGYPIDKLVQVDWWAKVSAGLAAAVSGAFGLSTARNDAPESAAQFALFRFVGGTPNELMISTSDGTNVQSQIDTGLPFAATLVRCTMDFASGLFSVAGGQSSGGKSNALFSAEDGRGNLKRVCASTRFNLSAFAGNFQLVAQIQKTSGVAVGTLSIQRVRVKYKQN